MLKIVLTAALAVSLSGCGLLLETKPLTADTGAELKILDMHISLYNYIAIAKFLLIPCVFQIFLCRMFGFVLSLRQNSSRL